MFLFLVILQVGLGGVRLVDDEHGCSLLANRLLAAGLYVWDVACTTDFGLFASFVAHVSDCLLVSGSGEGAPITGVEVVVSSTTSFVFTGVGAGLFSTTAFSF